MSLSFADLYERVPSPLSLDPQDLPAFRDDLVMSRSCPVSTIIGEQVGIWAQGFLAKYDAPVPSVESTASWMGLAWDVRPAPALPPKLTDGQWVFLHYSELALQYNNQWIAVHNGQVLAAGSVVKEVVATARHVCGANRFLLTRVNPQAWRDGLTW